jgi:GcrA cell cycle regulator
MHEDHWTAERIERLRELWAEGQTAAAIAVKLGEVSRSAVLGKIFRLRLPLTRRRPQQSSTNQAVTKLPAVAAVGVLAAEFSQAIVPARRRRSTRRKERPAAATAVRPQRAPGKKLLDLKNDSCRWPIGRPGTTQFHFCGVAEADLERGMPYCPQHARRAFTCDLQVAKQTPLVPRGEENAAVARPSPQRGRVATNAIRRS